VARRVRLDLRRLELGLGLDGGCRLRPAAAAGPERNVVEPQSSTSGGLTAEPTSVEQFSHAGPLSSSTGHGQHPLSEEAHPALERERLENRRYTPAIRTYFRRLEAAVAAGDDAAAETEHATLVTTIDKRSRRRPARNTGARKKSRGARARGYGF
jgi:ribosomal protein S20